MQVEQLWYTWTVGGLARAPGFQARAASDGLRDLHGGRYAALRPFLSYELPAGVSADPAGTPVCLALLEAGPERALIRKVYLGLDRHGRPGNFFVHALLGEAAALSLPRALASWSESFWRSSDAELPVGETALPPLNLGDPAPAPVWAGGVDGKHLRYVLAAALALAPGQHLYLAADPGEVIQLLEAVARALPRRMQHRITFSTYEHDPLRSPATIVGTTWPALSERWERATPDLPEACYQQGPALNCASGRQAALSGSSAVGAYAEFAAGCLERGDEAALCAFLDLADTAGVADTPTLLRAYAWCAATDDKARRVEELLDDPALFALTLAQPPVRVGLLAAWVAAPEQWRKRLGPALARLRRDAPNEALHGALAAFADEAVATALTRLAADDVESASLLVDDVALSADPAGAGRRCAELVAHLTSRLPPGWQEAPPEPLPWLAQHWLLRVAARANPQPAAKLVPWLRVTWTRLPQLAPLPLPDSWRVAAMQWAIVDGDPGALPDELVGFLDAYVDPFAQAVLGVVRHPERRPAVAALIAELGQVDARAYPVLVQRLLQSSVDDPDFFATIVDPVYHKGSEVLLDFVERNAAALLARGLIGSNATELLARYLEYLSAKGCRRLETRITLNRLRSDRRLAATPNLLRRLLAWDILAAFLASPEAGPAALQQLARALDDVRRLDGSGPDGDRQDVELAEVLVEALVTMLDTREQVWQVLEALDETFPGRACELLRRLDRAVPRDEPDRWIRRQVAYLHSGMTWSKPYCQVDDVFKTAIRHMDEVAFQAIDQVLRSPRSRDRLPGPALKKWEQWTSMLRPRPVWQRAWQRVKR